MKIKELELLCKEVLEHHPKKVEEYKLGKKELIGSFTGEVMIKSRGKADPRDIVTILKEQLK